MAATASRKTLLTALASVLFITMVLMMTHNWTGSLGEKLRHIQHEDAPRLVDKTILPTLPPPPTDDTEMRRRLFDYIENPEFGCKKLSMFGGVTIQTAIDGDKFICLDKGYAPPPGQCLVYSIGINNEWSFDKALIKYGCEVHAFDPSMTNFKKSSTDFGAHFYRIGLGPKTEYNNEMKWDIMTLGDIRAKLGHKERVIDYLKVDIEGGEWDWLEQEPNALDRVTQLGMEIHMPVSDFKKAKTMQRYYDIFRRMQQQGFYVIHTNPNRVRGRYLRLVGVPGKVTNLYELVWMKIV